MGILIGCERISMEWPGKRVLAEQTVSVNEGDRIGVVGKNGDGKTTLLEIIARTVEPDAGSVIWRNNIHVGVIGQHDALDDNETVGHAVVGDTPDYVWASDARIRYLVISSVKVAILPAARLTEGIVRASRSASKKPMPF